MDSVCTEISSASMGPIASLSLSLHNMSHHLHPMKIEAVNDEENIEESSQRAMEPCSKSDSSTEAEQTKSTVISSSSLSSSSSSSSSSFSASPAQSTVGLDPNASEFTPVNPSSNFVSASSSSLSSPSSCSIHLKAQPPSLINMNPRIYDCHQPMENAYNGLINISHHANHAHPNYIPEPDHPNPNLVERYSSSFHPNPNLAFNSAHMSPRQIMAPLVYPPANPSNLMHDVCNPRGASPTVFIHNQMYSHHSSSSKEHISRALLMTGVPPGISEGAIREEIEKSWGAIRSLQFERAMEGIILVQFYDLRSAKQALKDMQRKHLLRQQRFRLNQEEMSSSSSRLHSNHAMSSPPAMAGGSLAANASSSSTKENPNVCMNPSLHGIETADHHHHHHHHQQAQEGEQQEQEDMESSCAGQEGSKGLICGHVVWAQYIAAWNMPVEDAHNQGTLVLFNVGSDISMRELREVFERFGNVRELREAPMKKQHKFVEFYDIRDAAAAWSSLNGKEVCGKPMKIEFSKQGRLSNISINNGSNMSINNGSSGMAMGMSRKNAKGSPYPPLTTTYHPTHQDHHHHHHINQDQCGWIHGDHAYNGYHNMGYHPSYGMAMFPPSHIEWQRSGLDNSIRSPPPHSIVTTNGVGACGFNTFDYDPSLGTQDEMPPALMSYDHSSHDMKGKTPANGYNGGEVVAGPRRLRRSGSTNPDHKCSSVNTINNHIGVENVNCSSEKQMCEAMREPHHHHHHHHSHRGAGNLHFEFDEREVYVLSGNPRTTLMIRNIPNKYSQQMLLSLLDKHCLDCNRRILDINEPESAYDFVYLPIDFKNRCNLGYAFVNFTTALATLKFYKSFNEQAWEAFNSRKICKIAYARVQGRPALEDHFRNSRFACDTDEYLPLVFVPPRNGIEFPLPRVAAGQSGPSTRGGRTDGRTGSGSVRRASSSSVEDPKEEEEPKDACSAEESDLLSHNKGSMDKDSCECVAQSEDLQEEKNSMDCCNESFNSLEEQSCSKFGDMEGGVDLDLSMSKLEVEA